MLDPHIFPGHIPTVVTSCDIHLSPGLFGTRNAAEQISCFLPVNQCLNLDINCSIMLHQLRDYDNNFGVTMATLVHWSILVLIKFSHFGFIPPGIEDKHSMIMWICPSIPGLACCSFTILLPGFQTSKYPKTSQNGMRSIHFDTSSRSPWRPWCTMAKPAALSVPRILLLWLLTGFHLPDGDDPQDSPNRGALKRIAPFKYQKRNLDEFGISWLDIHDIGALNEIVTMETSDTSWVCKTKTWIGIVKGASFQWRQAASSASQYPAEKSADQCCDCSRYFNSHLTSLGVDVLLLSLFQGIRTIKRLTILPKMKQASFLCLPKAVLFAPCFRLSLKPRWKNGEK